MAPRSSAHLDLGHARDLLDLDVAGARRRRRSAPRRWSANPLSTARSGPKILTARSLLTPGDELVDAQRDRLRERRPAAPGCAAISARAPRRARALLRPVCHSRRGLSMMKTSLCSGPIGSSEISARPVLVTTVATSGKAQQPLLDHRRDRDRALERGVRQPDHVDRDRALVERRHEVGAHEAGPGRARPSSDGHRDAVGGRGPAHRARCSSAQVAAVEAPARSRTPARGACLSTIVRQRRHEEQRHDDRGEQREEQRQRQRAEHLALEPLQRQQRHEHERDDQDREGHRPGHLGHRRDDRRPRLARSPCSARWRRTFSATTIEASTTMPTEKASPPRLMRFDDSPAAPHDDEREEERDRQREDDDHRGAQLGEEQEEHEDDQQRRPARARR